MFTLNVGAESTLIPFGYVVRPCPLPPLSIISVWRLFRGLYWSEIICQKLGMSWMFLLQTCTSSLGCELISLMNDRFFHGLSAKIQEGLFQPSSCFRVLGSIS